MQKLIGHFRKFEAHKGENRKFIFFHCAPKIKVRFSSNHNTELCCVQTNVVCSN